MFSMDEIARIDLNWLATSDLEPMWTDLELRWNVSCHPPTTRRSIESNYYTLDIVLNVKYYLEVHKAMISYRVYYFMPTNIK